MTDENDPQDVFYVTIGKDTWAITGAHRAVVIRPGMVGGTCSIGPRGFSRTTIPQSPINPNAPGPALEVTPGAWTSPAPKMHSLPITPDMVDGTVRFSADGLTFIPTPPKDK